MEDVLRQELQQQLPRPHHHCHHQTHHHQRIQTLPPQPRPRRQDYHWPLQASYFHTAALLGLNNHILAVCHDHKAVECNRDEPQCSVLLGLRVTQSAFHVRPTLTDGLDNQLWRSGFSIRVPHISVRPCHAYLLLFESNTVLAEGIMLVAAAPQLMQPVKSYKCTLTCLAFLLALLCERPVSLLHGASLQCSAGCV